MLKAWIMAMRLRTLPVALAPVLVGTAVAYDEGRFSAGPALAALLGALLLQIISNFANDVFDFESGADNAARIGPPRATQQGLLTPSQMKQGIAVVIALAIGVGLYLISVAGWPVVAVGAASIAAALAYTGGPWPFGYKGLGDPAVFLFFGLVAVTGTHYVQALEISPLALAASVPVGCLATAILVVNNTRDIETDAAAGKMTIAVRLGPRGVRREYLALLAVAYAVLPLFVGLGGRSWFVLLPLITLPKALSLARTVRDTKEGPALNEALAGTAQLALFHSLLFAIGWVL